MPYKNIEKQKKYQNSWYQRNKLQVSESSAKRRRETALWFHEYKKKLSCKCGENHPACLQFHHRDPSTKKGGVTNLVHEAASRKRILAEIAKCDVVCANCHLKIHYEDSSLMWKFVKDAGQTTD